MSEDSSIIASLPVFGSNSGMSERVIRSPEARWAIQSPVSQREDRLPLEDAVAKWQKIYDLFSASGEKDRDEVFAAVLLYFMTNGCSPSGNYARVVKTAGGLSVPIANIVKITGRMDGDIRQFLRGRIEDAYFSLKYSPTLKNDEAARDKAESRGIPRDMAYLLADFLKDCEFFTPQEQAIYEKTSVKTIAAANARYDAAGRSHNVRVDEVGVADTVEQQAVDTGVAMRLHTGKSLY